MSTPAFGVFTNEAINEYTPRAANYDTSLGGWHAELGRDYASWLPPPRGGAVLDLACGTGLVSLPFAQGVGPGGIVVGIDVTEAMLTEATRKPLPADSGEVTWVLGDITDISSVEPVQKVMATRGGFDVISCCSALVLLEDPRRQLKHWVSFLKPRGRIIIDVPTEDHTLQYLFTGPVRRAVGKPYIFDREWVKDMHSLEEAYEAAGLEVERSFRTRSYLPEQLWGADDAMAVFEDKFGKHKWLSEDEAALQKAREVWPRLWAESLNDGQFWDGHALYVSIGRK